MAERSPAARMVRRWVLHPALGVFSLLVFGLFRILPVDAASALGGAAARLIGPKTRADKTARRNLARAFPDKSTGDIDGIMRGLWDNLGRTVAEYPHLARIPAIGPDSRVEVIDPEIITETAKQGGPMIILSAHMANWEISAKAATDYGVQFSGIYRAASNPIVERLMLDCRKEVYTEMLPKGRDGAKATVKVLVSGNRLGVLIDQKMNEGEPIPFFGRDAMTATSPAELGLRFGAPLIPVRVERLDGVHFRITVHPPVQVPEEGDRKSKARAMMTEVNALLESWVRERPEQWFWVHRRWPD